MKGKMSILGIGPILFVTSVVYSVLLVLLMKYFNYSPKIEIVPYFLLIALGILLIAVGLLFLNVSTIAINKAYKADQLYVKGAYSICRHPLYSAWILFMIPGILLLFNSWLLLTIPVFMYFAFRVMIKKEEIYLQDRFGEQYTKYRNSVGLFFPRFWKYCRNNEYN